MVNNREIEANLEMIEALQNLKPPTKLNELKTLSLEYLSGMKNVIKH